MAQGRWYSGDRQQASSGPVLRHTSLTNSSQRVEQLAKKKNVKMAQIAVAWSIAKTTAPIVGTTSLSNLQETIGMSREATPYFIILIGSDLLDAVKIELSEEDIKFLDEPYKPLAVIGHA
jgi:hypothetical protein